MTMPPQPQLTKGEADGLQEMRGLIESYTDSLCAQRKSSVPAGDCTDAEDLVEPGGKIQGHTLLGDSHLSNRNLIRFFRARNGRADAAVKLWLECNAWRKEMDVSRWRNGAPGPSNDLSVINTYNRLGFEAAGGVEKHPAIRLVRPLPRSQECSFRRWVSNGSFGHDKQGHPLYWERTGVGAVYFPNLVKEISHDDIILGHIRQQELALARCEEASLKFGKYIGKQTIVLDMKGLSMWPRAGGLSVFKRLLIIDSKYYPETLHCLFIINAPWIFCSIWKIIKPLLDPVTASKAKVLGSNYFDSLLEAIDADQIPVEFGGSLPIELEKNRLGDGEAEAFVQSMYSYKIDELDKSERKSCETGSGKSQSSDADTLVESPCVASAHVDGRKSQALEGGDSEHNDHRAQHNTLLAGRMPRKSSYIFSHSPSAKQHSSKTLDNRRQPTPTSLPAKRKPRKRTPPSKPSLDIPLEVKITSPLLWHRSATHNSYDEVSFPSLLSNVKLRGHNYMEDHVKVPAKPSIFELIGCEYFRHDVKIFRPFEERDRGTLLHRLRQLGDERYYFIVSLIAPVRPYIHCVLYFAVPAVYHPEYPAKAKRRDKAFYSLFRDFVFGTNSFRNSRFKVVPSVVDGHWAAQNAIDRTPVLLGRKVTQHYHKSQNHFELSVDIGSSKFASGIFKVLSSYASSLTVDLLFVLQGECKSELPERILGSVQIRRPDFSAGGSILLSNLYSQKNDRDQLLEAKRWYDSRARLRALQYTSETDCDYESFSVHGKALLQALEAVTKRHLREEYEHGALNAADVVLEADRLAANAIHYEQTISTAREKNSSSSALLLGASFGAEKQSSTDPYATNKAAIIAAREAATAAAMAAKFVAQKARTLEHCEVTRSLHHRGELKTDQFEHLTKGVGFPALHTGTRLMSLNDPLTGNTKETTCSFWVVLLAISGVLGALVLTTGSESRLSSE